MFLVVLLALCVGLVAGTPCVWQTLGVTFDLRPLTAVAGEKSFYILDGDLQCTADVTEPSFSYTWNFCSLVTPESVRIRRGDCTTGLDIFKRGIRRVISCIDVY